MSQKQTNPIQRRGGKLSGTPRRGIGKSATTPQINFSRTLSGQPYLRKSKPPPPPYGVPTRKQMRHFGAAGAHRP
eukprot:2020876-Lingulodinium_polyedra.AAC.1